MLSPLCEKKTIPIFPYFLNTFPLDFAFLVSLGVEHGMNLISAIYMQVIYSSPLRKEKRRNIKFLLTSTHEAFVYTFILLFLSTF